MVPILASFSWMVSHSVLSDNVQVRHSIELHTHTERARESIIRRSVLQK